MNELNNHLHLMFLMTTIMSIDIKNRLIELSCGNKCNQMFNKTFLDVFCTYLYTDHYAKLTEKWFSTTLNLNSQKN